MKPIVFALDKNIALHEALFASNQFDRGEFILRRFPDGESYVRILSECNARDIFILCTLYQPDSWIMPLLFMSETLRELNAASIHLVAPYLAYMRQDIRFHPGEAVNAKIFAALVSKHFDSLITIDPHLHRIANLSDIYAIPQQTLSAVPLLAEWLQREISNPLLIGPDSESEQWVANIARLAHAPYVVLEKIRRGDREVAIDLPDLTAYANCTPVLIDDIISTGHTLLEVIGKLRKTALPAPVCAAVHGLFAEDAAAKIMAAGAQRIVTCNTISHATNAVDISAILQAAMRLGAH